MSYLRVHRTLRKKRHNSIGIFWAQIEFCNGFLPGKGKMPGAAGLEDFCKNQEDLLGGVSRRLQPENPPMPNVITEWSGCLVRLKAAAFLIVPSPRHASQVSLRETEGVTRTPVATPVSRRPPRERRQSHSVTADRGTQSWLFDPLNI